MIYWCLGRHQGALPRPLKARRHQGLRCVGTTIASGCVVGANKLDLPNGVPRGFTDAKQFTQAGDELATALKNSGLDYKSIGVRGSSVTNSSSKGGGFRFGPENGMKASDVDVFIEFADDIALNSSKNIPGFIHPNKLLKNYPELKTWSDTWSKILGREITPGGFKPGTFTDTDVVKF